MSWILEEIVNRGGEASFREFMELALYHPQHGYYSGENPRYGRAADFLTAPTASHWYGSVLAGWCERLAAELGPLVVVDLAAGDGTLVARLLERLGGDADRLLRSVVLVERSDAMRRLADERLAELQVETILVSELEQVAAPSGPVLVHASELYDALPVHRVVAREEGLHELWVSAVSDQLEWREKTAKKELVSYFENHDVILEIDQIAEVNLAAAGLHAQVLEWSGERAMSVVLDYGYEARRLYNSRGRASGSLSCYRRHELSRDPLVHPGEQDITAHVNWDDLRRTAASWQEVGLWPLAELLVRAGLPAEMERAGLGMEAELDARTVSERQEIKRLLDPEGMGSDLKALVQATPAVAEVVARSLELDDARVAVPVSREYPSPAR